MPVIIAAVLFVSTSHPAEPINEWRDPIKAWLHATSPVRSAKPQSRGWAYKNARCNKPSCWKRH